MDENRQTEESQQQADRWHGVSANNRGWELWEQSSWSPAEAEEMLHAAHTAWYHWNLCGTDIHRTRAYILLAYAHQKCGSLRLARVFAGRAAGLLATEPEGIADWDHVFLLDVEGRLFRDEGSDEQSALKQDEARKALAEVASDGDREYAEATLNRVFDLSRVRVGEL